MRLGEALVMIEFENIVEIIRKRHAGEQPGHNCAMESGACGSLRCFSDLR
jgi:hypothetical protein